MQPLARRRQAVTGRRHQVISVSLPREIVERTNRLIPKARRSRVIAGVLTTFLDSVERGRVAERYRTYYAKRSPRQAREDQDILKDWRFADDQAWRILEREESRGLRTRY